jgi:hypothetical protein
VKLVVEGMTHIKAIQLQGMDTKRDVCNIGLCFAAVWCLQMFCRSGLEPDDAWGANAELRTDTRQLLGSRYSAPLSLSGSVMGHRAERMAAVSAAMQVSRIKHTEVWGWLLSQAAAHTWTCSTLGVCKQHVHRLCRALQLPLELVVTTSATSATSARLSLAENTLIVARYLH